MMMIKNRKRGRSIDLVRVWFSPQLSRSVQDFDTSFESRWTKTMSSTIQRVFQLECTLGRLTLAQECRCVLVEFSSCMSRCGVVVVERVHC